MLPILLLFFIMALSFFFSGFEAGFVSLDRYFVLFLSEIKKEKHFKKIKKLMDEKELVLTTLLICNNLTIVAATFVFNSFIVPDILSLAQLPSNVAAIAHITLSVIVLTPVLFFFCEVLPKSLFKTYPYRLTKKSYYLFIPFYILTYPAALFLNSLSKLILLLFKRRGKKSSTADETAYFTGTLSRVNKQLSSSIEETSIKKIVSNLQFSVEDFAQEIDSSFVFGDYKQVKEVKDKVLASLSSTPEVLYIFVTTNGKIKGFIKIDALNKASNASRLKSIMSPIKKIDPEKTPIKNLFAYANKSVLFFEKGEKTFFIDSRVLLKKVFT